MAKTLQEKRRADRDRKRRQRARARELRAPGLAAVHRAVVEALGFALVTAPVKAEWRPDEGWCPVSITVIIDTAVDILVKRHAFDRSLSRKAVRATLAPREEWRWPSNVPTTNPPAVDVEIGVTTLPPVA